MCHTVQLFQHPKVLTHPGEVPVRLKQSVGPVNRSVACLSVYKYSDNKFYVVP